MQTSWTADDSIQIMEKTKTAPCGFMNEQEMKTLQWLNIARMYPAWYVHINQLKLSNDPYEKSLFLKLNSMEPIKTKIETDSMLWISALCHAKSSGEKAYIGHERQDTSCKMNLSAECCYFGGGKPQSVIYKLLLDHGVLSLGHRKICLDPNLSKIGISIMPHNGKFKKIAVLDFK